MRPWIKQLEGNLVFEFLIPACNGRALGIIRKTPPELAVVLNEAFNRGLESALITLIIHEEALSRFFLPGGDQMIFPPDGTIVSLEMPINI